MESDLFNPDTEADVLYAAGTIVGESGKASFARRRAVDDSSDSLLALLMGASTPGLPPIDGLGAPGDFACYDPQFAVHMP